MLNANKILSLLMAIIFTISNVGIAVHHHYCVHEGGQKQYIEIATDGQTTCCCATQENSCCGEPEISCCDDEAQKEIENCNHCLSSCRDEFEIEKLTEIFTARDISQKTNLIPTDITQKITNSVDFMREKNIRAKLMSFSESFFRRKTIPFPEFNKFIILTKSTASSDKEDHFIS